MRSADGGPPPSGGHSQVDLIVADVLAVVDVEDLGLGHAGKTLGQRLVVVLGDCLPQGPDFGRSLLAGVFHGFPVRTAGRRDRVGDGQGDLFASLVDRAQQLRDQVRSEVPPGTQGFEVFDGDFGTGWRYPPRNPSPKNMRIWSRPSVSVWKCRASLSLSWK